MSLFGRFRREIPKTVFKPVDTKDCFETLKSKYESALNAAAKEHIVFQSVHIADGRLVVRGTAPSPEAKSLFGGAIRNVDSEPDDIVTDIRVSDRWNHSLTDKTYIVQAGDTLSKISREFYGDPNETGRIYVANPGRIDRSRNVRVGQELTIPADDMF